MGKRKTTEAIDHAILILRCSERRARNDADVVFADFLINHIDYIERLASGLPALASALPALTTATPKQHAKAAGRIVADMAQHVQREAAQ